MAQGFSSGIPIDIDGTLAANSDQLVPSQKAVKTFAIPKTAITTAEDILIQRGGIPTRLPVGAEGYILKIVGGLIVWTSVALALTITPDGGYSDGEYGIIMQQSPIVSSGNPS